jgi:MOSC domain-containing protein YiiM
MDQWIDLSIEADLDAPEWLSLLNDPFLSGGRQEQTVFISLGAPSIIGRRPYRIKALSDDRDEWLHAFEAAGAPLQGNRERTGWLARQFTRTSPEGFMMSVHATGEPRLHQISISDGGVPKVAVPHAEITAAGVTGDRQRNPDIHGGPDRAVCLYSLDVIQALRAEGHPIAPGSTGENLTLAGIDWTRIKPGVRLRVGPVRLEIVSYTAPCVHNGRWFLNEDFSRMSQKKFPGWSRVYARVLTEGTVGAGDPVEFDT